MRFILPQLVRKLVVDFLQVIIEYFLLALTVEAVQAKIRRNERLLRRVGHFETKYQVEELRLSATSIHRQIREWLYYNFAAGSFHINKLSSTLYSTEIEFYSRKRQIRFLSHPLEELRVTYGLPSIARWKCTVDFHSVIAAVKKGIMEDRRTKVLEIVRTMKTSCENAI